MRTYAVVATAEPAQAIAASSKPLPITLTAHLKKAGEVMSSEGWVGLPGTDDFIESFAVDWAESLSASICSIPAWWPAPAPAAMSPPALLSALALKACRYCALGFSLVGPLRKHYEMTGLVVFGNAEPQRLVANQMMHGPHRQRAVGGAAYRLDPRYEDERCPP